MRCTCFFRARRRDYRIFCARSIRSIGSSGQDSSHADHGNIILPKFETAYSEQLNDVLNEMGMKLAFDSSRADFSRIPLNPTPGNALYISGVEHKTWIKVDEEGTEAGAATSLEFELAARIAHPSFVMIVDHPFFFAITEQQSGALLFAGVVMDPTLTGGAQ